MEGNFPVVWTEFAENQLDEIFEYFLAIAGFDQAQKIVQKLIISTKVLESQPEVGQFEEALLNRKEGVRYLVEGNFKILYMIIRFFASSSKWPRLRSATGFQVIIGRGGKCGAAAFSSPAQKPILSDTERSRGET